jgi:trk system potassium uptake protein TrkA
MLIEQSMPRCERIVAAFNTSNLSVTHGDGTDAESLLESGVRDAEALIAVTGQDQNNFVACQLGKDYFGVKRTIARVKNPKNIRVFEKLGVNSVISSTSRIAGSINQELDWSDVNQLFLQAASHVRVKEAIIGESSPFCGKRLCEIGLPKGMIMVCLVRGNIALIPNGETQLLADDSVIMLGAETELPDVLEALRGKVK